MWGSLRLVCLDWALSACCNCIKSLSILYSSSAIRVAIPEHWPFWKEQLVLQIPLYNYWKVIPQFVPLNGLHADITVLWIGAVQAERVYISVQRKFVLEKIKMSVTSAHIECATGKRYRSIELVESFLLKYRCWAFAKIIASALWKQFWTSGIAN